MTDPARMWPMCPSHCPITRHSCVEIGKMDTVEPECVVTGLTVSMSYASNRKSTESCTIHSSPMHTKMHGCKRIMGNYVQSEPTCYNTFQVQSVGILQVRKKTPLCVKKSSYKTGLGGTKCELSALTGPAQYSGEFEYN